MSFSIPQCVCVWKLYHLRLHFRFSLYMSLMILLTIDQAKDKEEEEVEREREKISCEFIFHKIDSHGWHLANSFEKGGKGEAFKRRCLPAVLPQSSVEIETEKDEKEEEEEITP